MAIFQSDDVADVQLTNHHDTNSYRFTRYAKLLNPKTTATLKELNIDFCEFKRFYLDTTSRVYQLIEIDQYIEATDIEIPGQGVVCSFYLGEGGNFGVNPSMTPPLLPVAGQQWMKLPDSELYIWDSSRSKWLSSDIKEYVVSRNFPTTPSSYLYREDGIASNIAPFIAQSNITVVGAVATDNNNGNWNIELKTIPDEILIATVPVSSGLLNISNLNIDISINTKFAIFLNGISIEYPAVTLISKKKHS